MAHAEKKIKGSIAAPKPLRGTLQKISPGRKFVRTSGLVFLWRARRRKLFLFSGVFVLEQNNFFSMLARVKGEGEDKQRVVNNLLIAWARCQIKLAMSMTQPGLSDLRSHTSLLLRLDRAGVSHRNSV
jgi:hypothetical protein